MRKILVCLALLAAAPQTAVNLSGTWRFEQTNANGRKRVTICVFQPHGSTFTGTFATLSDRGHIVHGQMHGKQITFDVQFDFDVQGKPTQYQGEIDGESLKLTRTEPPAGRPNTEIVLHKTSAATTYVPPPELGPAHKPFPPFKPIAPNGLALTPPMGWNSWNKFAGRVDDKTIRAVADAMVASGMRDAGYIYVNIDDTWEGSRDKDGNIQSNEKFPDMKALADYVHAKGLKLGIYSSPGPTTCAGFAGSYGHEEQDARTWAAWGVDYLKYDWCSASAVYQRDEMKPAYRKMALALRATGRPIVFSLCQYGLLHVEEWGPAVGGNLWRTTDDISDNWARMSEIGFGQEGNEKYAAPGHWNDPDMLEIGNGGMTHDEYVTHMSLWALLAAPLLAGNDIASMTEDTKSILTNKEVIAIDQDRKGVQAHRISQQGQFEIWTRPLADGSQAVGLFNRGDSPSPITLDLKSIGITHAARIRDLWKHQDESAADPALPHKSPPMAWSC